MRRMIILSLSLVFAASSALAVAATEKNATKDPMTAFQRDLVNVLALRAEAKPLLGAALLSRTLPDPPSFISFHTLLQRAQQGPHAGPAITWAQLVDCSPKAEDCPNTKALAKLQQQAPGNAAVWLTALGQAVHNDDTQGAHAALAKAADATQYDDYTGISLQALATAADTLPPPTDLYERHGAANSAAGVRAILVFGLGSMQPLPGFQAAAHLCKQGKDDDATRSQCLKLAKVLVWGSAPLARSLGLHLQQTLSDDADLRKQAANERRDLTWQVRNYGKLVLQSRKDQALARRLLDLARHGGTQMSLILAALRASKIQTHAPTGWKPPHQQHD